MPCSMNKPVGMILWISNEPQGEERDGQKQLLHRTDQANHPFANLEEEAQVWETLVLWQKQTEEKPEQKDSGWPARRKLFPDKRQQIT